MSRSRWLLLGVVGLTVTVSACSGQTALAPESTNAAQASSDATPPTESASAAASEPASTATYALGDRIQIGDAQYFTAQEVVLWPGDEFIKADPGNKIVSVRVEIEGISADGASYNPFFFSAKDPDGFEYNFSPFGQEPQLQSGNNLAAGDKVAGWVSFEVPETTSELILAYQPDFFDVSDPARVKIQLP